MTGFAEAKHVDTMAVELEPLSFRQTVQVLSDRLLECHRRRDVTDLSTVGAKQMVVVFGEVLGQLESGKFIVGNDPPDDAGRLKVYEVPVGRTTRKIRKVVGDVADAHRMTGGCENVDDAAPALRVPLVDTAKPVLDEGVQFVRCLVVRCHGLGKRRGQCSSQWSPWTA